MLTVKEKKELSAAVENGNIAAVEQAINNKKFEVNEVIDEEFESTALHIAAASGQAQMVNFLIDQGADLNVRDKYKNVPLGKAICRLGSPCNKEFDQHRDIIEILLKSGANPILITEKGEKIPLHLLADKQVKYIVYEIFDRLGKISSVDSSQQKEDLEKPQSENVNPRVNANKERSYLSSVSSAVDSIITFWNRNIIGESTQPKNDESHQPLLRPKTD